MDDVEHIPKLLLQILFSEWVILRKQIRETSAERRSVKWACQDLGFRPLPEEQPARALEVYCPQQDSNLRCRIERPIWGISNCGYLTF